MKEVQSITKEKAFILCDEIRKENRKKWWYLQGYQCWGCFKFSGGDYQKMCLCNGSEYTGCYMINTRYLKLVDKTGANNSK